MLTRFHFLSLLHAGISIFLWSSLALGQQPTSNSNTLGQRARQIAPSVTRQLSSKELYYVRPSFAGPLRSAGSPQADPARRPPLLPAAKDEREEIGAWSLVCNSDNIDPVEKCGVVQSQIATEDASVWVNVVIRVRSVEGLSLRVIVPDGVSTRNGIAVLIDNLQVINLPIDTCSGGACFAESFLSANLLEALFNGEKIQLEFKRPDSDFYSLSLSLAKAKQAVFALAQKTDDTIERLYVGGPVHKLSDYINSANTTIRLCGAVANLTNVNELKSLILEHKGTPAGDCAEARTADLETASSSSKALGILRASFKECDNCPEMFEVAVPENRRLAVGKYEITFSDWDACVRDAGCSHNPSDNGWGRDRQPVINVSWSDAKEYTKWLTKKSGRPYRLLTEGEWEFISGVREPQTFAKNILSGWLSANAGGKPHPVGESVANRHGMHDAVGNVWEWVEDCAQGPSTDGCQHVLKGGSWTTDPLLIRPLTRAQLEPDKRMSHIGFRVARPVE